VSNKYWVRVKVFAYESTFKDRMWRVVNQVPNGINIVTSVADFAHEVNLVSSTYLPVFLTFAFLGVSPRNPFRIGFEFGHQFRSSDRSIFWHQTFVWRTTALTGPPPINIDFRNDEIGGSASNALLSPDLWGDVLP
jgi:hypothetical protein